MVTLTAPDGRILAEVSHYLPDLVEWMNKQPEKLRYRYSQEKHLGTISLKNAEDIDRVRSFIHRTDEVNG